MSAPTPNPSAFFYSSALGEDFVKLTGVDNFDTWFTAFKAIVDEKGYAKYYKGQYDAIVKPKLPRFVDAATMRLQLKAYNVQYERWKEMNWGRNRALALLREAIEPWMWSIFSEEEQQDPALAWTAIDSCYNPNLSQGSSEEEIV